MSTASRLGMRHNLDNKNRWISVCLLARANLRERKLKWPAVGKEKRRAPKQRAGPAEQVFSSQSSASTDSFVKELYRACRGGCSRVPGRCARVSKFWNSRVSVKRRSWQQEDQNHPQTLAVSRPKRRRIEQTSRVRAVFFPTYRQYCYPRGPRRSTIENIKLQNGSFRSHQTLKKVVISENPFTPVNTEPIVGNTHSYMHT